MTEKSLKRSIGLKWRFILIISMLLIFSCAALSFFLISRFSKSAIDSQEHHGKTISRNIAHNSEFSVMLEITPELDEIINGAVKNKDVLFVEIYNLDGKLLASNWNKSITETDIPVCASPTDFIHQNYSIEHAFSCQTSLNNGNQILDVVSPVQTTKTEISKEEMGTTKSLMTSNAENKEIIGFVRIGVDLEVTNSSIKYTTKIIFLFTSLLVLIGILLSVKLVRMITRPIDTMIEATEIISSGDLSQRVEESEETELARLAISFNKMCDSLERSQLKIESYNQTLEDRIIERTRELQSAQQQVVQSEKMAAVGQLAAGVAHELNNPLGGILGYSQFALEKINNGKLEEDDIETYKRYLEDIEKQARRCKMIVKNLLKFSRTSDKKVFEYFDINDALEEIFLLTKHQIDMKNINIRTNLSPELPQINGNRSVLQQVFTNIIINGMQSMNEGGSLTITSRAKRSVDEFGEDTIEIAFTDTGTGISKGNINKIFEPFFTTKKVGEGTGLGLSVSYGIIQEHGGDIKIESEVGQGSTIIVILPIIDEKKNTNSNKVDNLSQG